MHLPDKPRVLIYDCPDYDAHRIEQIIGTAMDELGLRPHGRTLVKPNLVAAGELFPHAHTRPEFAEGVLRALQARAGSDLEELAVGERCGITVPTRLAFRESGFDDMLEKFKGVKRYLFEEEQQVEIPLTHPQRLRDYLFTPEPVARADFFVNLPKFKAHPWTTVTFGLKNYIGIQDDRHRLIDHDHKLNEKVADLQFIVQPRLICIDAIIAGEGRMLTPIPKKLGLVIVGNSQVAIDSIGCRIIGLDPMSVDHIRLASEYGFGSTALEDVELGGDVTLKEAQKRAEGFKVGLVRVEQYFEGTKISAYAGPPPDSEHSDYCWGGCPGAIEEAIEVLRLYDEQIDEKMPRIHVVFGAYDGEIPAGPGEKVVFMGDCTKWKGDIGGDTVSVESLYRDRSTKDPHRAKHDDIYKKMAVTTAKMLKTKNDNHIRLEGCPVSVAEQALLLVSLAGAKNPYLAPDQIVSFNRGYFGWRGRALFNRVMGKKYQTSSGPFRERGDGAPEV